MVNLNDRVNMAGQNTLPKIYDQQAHHYSDKNFYRHTAIFKNTSRTEIKDFLENTGKYQTQNIGYFQRKPKSNEPLTETLLFFSVVQSSVMLVLHFLK